MSRRDGLTGDAAGAYGARMREATGSAPRWWRSDAAVVGVLGGPVLALMVLYGVLAVAVHDPLVLGLPGAFPADAGAVAAAGLVILWHRRNHPAGWVLLAAGLLLLLQTDGVLLSIVHYRRHTDPLPLGSVAVLAGLLWVPIMASIPPAVALFPDGRIPLRHARAPLYIFAAAAVTISAAFYLHAIHDLTTHQVTISLATGDLTDVDTPHGSLAWWYAGWGVLVVGGLVGAIIGLVVKYRRVDGETRQQLRWFIFGASLAALAVVPVVATSAVNVPQDSLANQLPTFALAVTLAGLPATVVVGILRYRLYDLNVVVSRSISYGLVAAGITGAYLAVVTLLGVAVGDASRSVAVSVLATLAAAATFQPVRVGAHRVANRAVYGKRATPYEALSSFADQLGSTPVLGTVLSRAADVLAAATGAQRVIVWLTTEENTLRAVATCPITVSLPQTTSPQTLASKADPHTITEFVTHHDQILGAISVTKRRDDPITPTDRHLLHQLAAQAGLALRNAKLAADLHQRFEDLLASRQRLVAAQDEARRHIERDLHDGAQQHLIALNMKLGRLRQQLPPTETRAARTVAQLQADVDTAIEHIRALGHGIYPSLLADQGLTPALRSQLRNAPLPVALESTLSERCPQPLEAAAYFCVMEALQNTYRHAAASRAQVRLSRSGESLLIEVTDDGRGFIPSQHVTGTGLTNIKDRVESLGGCVRVRSAPGGGSSVRIQIPAVGPPGQHLDELARLGQQ